MKPISIQKLLFGLGVFSVLGCGAATPFRPSGWVSYRMSIGECQSMEYCSLRTPGAFAVDGVSQQRDSDSFDTEQTDPFLAIEGKK